MASVVRKSKTFGKDTYVGDLSDNKPHGLGKMYKSTGDLFLGNFNKGKAEGKGAYIMKDGSYYKG